MRSSQSKRSMRAAAGRGVAALVALANTVPVAAMEWREASFEPSPGGTAVQYVVVTVPVANANLRVMVPALGRDGRYSQRPQSSSGSGRYSTKASIDPTQTAPVGGLEDAVKTAYVKSLQSGPVVVMSGAFSTIDPSRPAGLVVAGGELVRQLNLVPYSARPVAPGATCSGTDLRYKWSGILCSTGDTVRIKPTVAVEHEADGFAALEQCHDALQSFPLLVEPGGLNGICSDESTRTSSSYKPIAPMIRSVVCLTRNGQLKLIVTGPTHLHTLARHLISAEECNVALNLAGSLEAGLAYRSSAKSEWRWWPATAHVRPTLASVVVVSEKLNTPTVPSSVRKK